jgi:alkylation response protein AidB-like acyl-CoA dehydrogenase
MSRTPWTSLPAASEVRHWDSVAQGVAAALAVDAVPRDRANQLAAAELRLLKDSGLANLLIPTRFGGHGAHWSTAMRAVRILARADASIAQLLAYNYITQSGIVFLGDPARWQHWFEASAAGNWLWGDSVNPIDPALTLTARGSGYVLNGRKRYSTGAATGDVTAIMGVEEPGGRVLVAVIDHDRPGVRYLDDWDALGQRLSASGSVEFRDVIVEAGDILGHWREEPYATLSSPVSQLCFANMYLGIAEGALDQARRLTLARNGAWPLGQAEHHSRDPFVQRMFGELVARVAATESFADRWNTLLDELIARGSDVTFADRAEIEVGIAQVKIISTETALEVATRIYEATGASSTRSDIGLDMYWRNIRTHSLHDPVDYKKLEVGANYLTGDVQSITLYT